MGGTNGRKCSFPAMDTLYYDVTHFWLFVEFFRSSDRCDLEWGLSSLLIVSLNKYIAQLLSTNRATFLLRRGVTLKSHLGVTHIRWN